MRYSLIWAIQVCAAPKGIVFALYCLKLFFFLSLIIMFKTFKSYKLLTACYKKLIKYKKVVIQRV